MTRMVGTGRLLALMMALALAACARHEGAPEGRALPAANGPVPATTPAPVLRLGIDTAGRGGPAPVRLTRAMGEKALQDGVLQIELADGTRYPVRIEGARAEPDGRNWTLTGRVQTRAGTQAAVLTFGPDAVFGVLPGPDGRLLSVTTTRGLVSVGPDGGMVPPGKDAADHPDFRLPPTAQKPGGAIRVTTAETATAPVAAASGRRRVASATASTEVRVDLLGLYSDELVALRGTVAAAETEVVNQIAITNQAHVDSGSRVRFSLVGKRRVAVEPGAHNEDLLYAITDNQLAGTDVLSLRDSLAADLVFLLRPHAEGDPTCGIAWLNGGGLQATDVSDHFGYAVSNGGEVCSAYVLPHELGHNLGSAHDRETASSQDGSVQYGAFAYSFGHRQPGFATIMAYEQFGEPRVGYFSNPRLTRCGAPCGVAGGADNVRSFDAMASAIAAFRGPPGTLAIADAVVVEPTSGGSGLIGVPIRLSGPAPVGGVSLYVDVTGGTAKEGLDYLRPASTQLSIPQGERETRLYIELLPDDVAEASETITVALRDTVGAALGDATAVVTVLDDDPRPMVTGNVRFAPDWPPPTTAFDIQVSGAERWASTQSIRVSPPDFRYAIPVFEGAEVMMVALAPAPWTALPLRLTALQGNLQQDLYLRPGFEVSGKLRLPQGLPAPAFPLELTITESHAGLFQPDRRLQLDGPGDDFAFFVVPGAWITIRAMPTAPYQPYLMVNSYVDTPLANDIVLSTLPSLALWGNAPLPEGRSGTHSSGSLVAELSAPAPAAGVSFRYRTRDGTATAGKDYVAGTGTITFAPGETIKFIPFDIPGDDRYEGTSEYFDLLIDDVQGAVASWPRARQLIREDDARTGGPLRPRKR